MASGKDVPGVSAELNEAFETYEALLSKTEGKRFKGKCSATRYTAKRLKYNFEKTKNTEAKIVPDTSLTDEGIRERLGLGCLEDKASPECGTRATCFNNNDNNDSSSSDNLSANSGLLQRLWTAAASASTTRQRLRQLQEAEEQLRRIRADPRHVKAFDVDINDVIKELEGIDKEERKKKRT